MVPSDEDAPNGKKQKVNAAVAAHEKSTISTEAHEV